MTPNCGRFPTKNTLNVLLENAAVSPSDADLTKTAHPIAQA